MPSSGPDDGHAWLQVGAAAPKQCVALGCVLEATLLLEAAQTSGPARGEFLHIFDFLLSPLRRVQPADAQHARRSLYLWGPSLTSIGLITSPARVGRSGCLNPPQPLRVVTAGPDLYGGCHADDAQSCRRH